MTSSALLRLCFRNRLGLPLRQYGVACLVVTLLGACGGLLPKPPLPPTQYALDGLPKAGTVPPPTATNRVSTLPSMMVSLPHAAAGFDSQRLIYTKSAHRIEAFAHHEWVDTPARMLGPLIVAGLQGSAQLLSVVLAPSMAVNDLRLDSEIIRLQQDFSMTPSRVRFTLRGYLIDSRTRQILDWREFDETVLAVSDDPYGGIVAANLAVQAVLKQLRALSDETASRWQVTPAGP